MRLAPFGDALIVNADDLGGEVAVRAVPPELVDREHLHVDAARVHSRQAIGSHDLGHGVIALDVRAGKQLARFGNDQVTVDVDHFHALAGNHDLFAPSGSRGGPRNTRRNSAGIGGAGRSSGAQKEQAAVRVHDFAPRARRSRPRPSSRDRVRGQGSRSASGESMIVL